MKKILLLIGIICFSVSIVDAQACGKSVRTIVLEYQPKATLPETVSYELFYLAPKEDGGKPNDYEKLSKFLSDFLGYTPPHKGNRFWGGYGDGNPDVNVPMKKAEDYIKDYKVEDFSSYYTHEWHDNHLSQLKGKFVNNVLKLETRETDITPFIMRIKAKGYKTLYLLSSFLGGCFNSREPQTIQMIKTKK